ncbi:hypothetical protein E5676_scaffold390G00170 [Cucumis melo var. makuwa]|uniref:Uncharacterized protein n=2 Tax=Cucumis melo TaxID=3656 RepID=A0A5D3D548_CUCMM|nr:hypothetical protein E5676_scaffold390G00170 [Cucumis melo var. makuwa]
MMPFSRRHEQCVETSFSDIASRDRYSRRRQGTLKVPHYRRAPSVSIDGVESKAFMTGFYFRIRNSSHDTIQPTYFLMVPYTLGDPFSMPLDKNTDTRRYREIPDFLYCIDTMWTSVYR